MSTEHLFHVTVMSNFARAYDKYSRAYSKAHIPESRFPGEFYLLKPADLQIGIAKARSLLEKNNVAGDRLLALEVRAATADLLPNSRTGLGFYVNRNWVQVEALSLIGFDGVLSGIRIEEAYAESMRLLTPSMKPYSELQPRSVSVLPIAIGCQAACPFCYSKASASVDQVTRPTDLSRLRSVLRDAQRLGACRAVITGGGEPGLLRFDRLVKLVRECAQIFSKVVLITNGYFLQTLSDSERDDALVSLTDAGLRVLSVSRHHHAAQTNFTLMKLDTRPERIAASWTAMKKRLSGLRLRWVCVLQRGGIDSSQSLADYLDWTTANGVSEICFKELYVSTSHESVYHDYAANEWSYRHQVSLQLVVHFAHDRGWTEVDRLPWGSPVFQGSWNGLPVRVAAYTEPSLFWERSQGIARSWNLMADGRCLASLEDRDSRVC